MREIAMDKSELELEIEVLKAAIASLPDESKAKKRLQKKLRYLMLGSEAMSEGWVKGVYFFSPLKGSEDE
jgi:hypothetical protein